MKTRKTACLILLPLLLLGGYAASQPAEPGLVPSPASSRRDPDLDAYIARMRAELSTGKVTMINDVMNLAPAQAAAFWPVYTEYEQDLFALGDRRLELMKRFVTAQSAGTIDNSLAATLASEWLQLQRDATDLMQTYHARFSKEVSPLHAAQFLQIEHRSNTFIDLMIASQMPLVMEKAPTSAGAGK